jgi:predicted nucleic acid-binding protein
MIVLDSSFLISAFNDKEVQHPAAVSAYEDFLNGRWGKGLVLEWVFVETVHVLKRKVSGLAALHTGNFLKRAREVEFIPCSELFAPVWQEFQDTMHTKLSFVDVAVIRVARERAGGKVLTFDRAFRDIPGVKVEPST